MVKVKLKKERIMKNNYEFHVNVEDVNLMTVEELKRNYGYFGNKNKKEIVDYLTTRLKSIIGNRITLKKWEGYTEYPCFDNRTVKRLRGICDWWCSHDNSTIYFKTREYADQYVNWMKIQGKEVKLYHLGYEVE